MADEKISEVMSKVQALTEDEKIQFFIDFVSNANVAFISNLTKKIEEKFGISAAAAVMTAPIGQSAQPKAAAQEEERASYDIFLKDIGPKKVEVIKVVKNITGMGLIEAKNLVEKAPVLIKQTVPKDDALKMKKDLEAAGATVELK
jgi:large subunit ribosomal protein L7/L12